MLNIGIETNRGLVYEGSGGYGHAIWPSPMISHAKIVFASEGSLVGEAPSETLGWRFREDVYDPVSRIRRGRFYFASGSQPTTWTVQPHPALPFESAPMVAAGAYTRGFPKELDTFYGRSIWHEYVKGRKEQALVLLGLGERITIWTIINIEAISTGEELVTLKARSGLGILPKIDNNKIPQPFHSRVEERLDTFLDEVHRSAPASVIDRGRDAATQILLAHFQLEGDQSRDLGKLANKLDEQERYIAACAARIINVLHSRGKPSERGRREMREIREQDAELAAQCVGTILCELGWADWVSG